MSVRSKLFLIPKFRVTFKLILKINVLSMHKNQCTLKFEMKKKKFETNCLFDVF